MKVAKIGNELVCAEVGHYYETLRGTGIQVPPPGSDDESALGADQPEHSE